MGHLEIPLTAPTAPTDPATQQTGPGISPDPATVAPVQGVSPVPGLVNGQVQTVPPATTPAADKLDEKPADKTDLSKLPADVQAVIAELRKEAAENRTGKTAAEKKHDDAMAAMAKALGLAPDDTPDPAKLQEELGSTKHELYTLRVEKALGGICDTAKADVALTTAVLGHEGKLDNLDPTAADFATQLKALVDEAVSKNPKLKAGQAPAASSVDHTGRPGETMRSGEPMSLANAVADAYGT